MAEIATHLRDQLQGLNLYLVGMMGAGKSTIARLLARKLGYGFCDTDTIVEQAAGCSISDLFSQAGETAFRDLETQVLSQVCSHRRLAIATGGGIVLRQVNWSYLHHGLVIWLDVPVEQLIVRLRHDTRRPLLQQPDPLSVLRNLAEQRRSRYAQADIHLAIGEQDTPDRVVSRILAILPERLNDPPQPPTPPVF